MSVLICPGFHGPQLTQSFLQGVQGRDNWLIFPTQRFSPYSALDILQFLHQQQKSPSQTEPVLFIGFSAGVVGAMGAALAWQLQSGQVKALIAIDGWGVPLAGNFSIYRLSHDYFTHWSSALLGAGKESFYAAPPVGHLDLWRSPQTSLGWAITGSGYRQRCCAAEFLQMICQRYQEM